MKLHWKSFAAGAVAATVGIATVFAAQGVKSAALNNNKIIFDGRELDLGKEQMLSVVLEGEQNASNYMPIRKVLTGMGYDVGWDGSKGAVIVKSYGNTGEELESINLEELSGFWKGSLSDEEPLIYYFQFYRLDFPGFVTVYTEKEGKPDFKQGIYSVDLDNSILDCEFMVHNGKDISEFQSIDFTLENDILDLFDEDNKTLELEKANTNPKADAQGGLTPANIAGKWLCCEFDENDDDFNEYFSFTEEGKISSGSYVYEQHFAMEGSYKIEKGLLTATFTAAEIGGELTSTGDPLVLSYAAKIKDGRLRLYNGSEYHEMTRE